MRAQYWIILWSKEYACTQSTVAVYNREGFLVYNFHFHARVCTIFIFYIYEITSAPSNRRNGVNAEKEYPFPTRGLNIKQSFNELETGMRIRVA